ncbi:tRNA (guanosine(46)-N7)-methyltransferase TrmB [Halocola ammonii]
MLRKEAMGKDKLRKFAENKTFDHVIEPEVKAFIDNDHPKKGKWKSEVFGNENPITLELGCGKGEYTVGLAKRFPERNFIGVDIKGARIWRGAKTVEEQNIENVAFLRTKIEFIDRFFEKNEVDEIWLTFSDPQPKDDKGSKRLSSPKFLERYRKFVKPGGIINVKTDSRLFYDYTLEVVEEEGLELLIHNDNIYEGFLSTLDQEMQDILSIRTFYEQKWLGEGIPIKYIKFKL